MHFQASFIATGLFAGLALSQNISITTLPAASSTEMPLCVFVTDDVEGCTGTSEPFAVLDNWMCDSPNNLGGSDPTGTVGLCGTQADGSSVASLYINDHVVTYYDNQNIDDPPVYCSFTAGLTIGATCVATLTTSGTPPATSAPTSPSSSAWY
ncbi:hypothetical protein N7510_005070 [Penicillium lagena]|uniref:uncharacterized protein n=1 Tax=Penicillium lagena TaxID=94218 RepID=UPI0025400726|nr:uncharacterized protein N7510_005070 [Penicillium lagena]KAJ5621086.1 hypothetical protein N7510_005070 [Penicillium lagena]